MPLPWFSSSAPHDKQTQSDLQTQFGRQRFLNEQTSDVPLSRRRIRLGSFLNSDGADSAQQSNDKARRALPSLKRPQIRIITLLSCIVLWVVCALSTDFAFELSPPPSLPFALRVFTSGFDVFSSCRLPTTFTLGRYNLEFRLGPDFNSTLSPVLDHGSLSAGGRTIDELTSATYSPPSRKSSAIWRGIFLRGARANNSPALALTDGIEPGQCWAFRGDSGQLGIRLAQAIRVSTLTVGHANRSSAISAPKNVALWGLKPTDSEFCASLGDVGTPRPNFGSGYCGARLLSGIYEPSQSTPYQNFTAHIRTEYSPHDDYFDHMIVEVSGNWGHPTFTCIYRVQIYGTTFED